MTDVTSLISKIGERSNGDYKVVVVELFEDTATIDDTDTFTITLSTYGIKKLLWVNGYTHTTDNSVIVEEAPTTAVSAGVLTVTVGGSTDNKNRVFEIVGRGN